MQNNKTPIFGSLAHISKTQQKKKPIEPDAPPTDTKPKETKKTELEE
jgi:hypothetical protein